MTTQPLPDPLASTLQFDSTITPTPDYNMKRMVTPISLQSDRNQPDPHGNQIIHTKMHRIGMEIIRNR